MERFVAGREFVCGVHQSLPSPGELNKLIGRLMAASKLDSVVPIHAARESQKPGGGHLEGVMKGDYN